MSAFEENFGWLIRNASNLHSLLNEIGFAAEHEIRENFLAGGRPVPWSESTRVKAFGGETLRDKGMLMNSITHNVDSPTSVVIGPGSAVAFKAKFLYYGGVIKPKNGMYLTFRIPSRLMTTTKSGKELKRPKKEYTFVRVRQVIGKPHNYLYLPPEFFDRVHQIVTEATVKQ
ncbi:MAG: hypothetical protein AB1600_00330 [Bacteroidota bacterium]